MAAEKSLNARMRATRLGERMNEREKKRKEKERKGKKRKEKERKGKCILRV
jgi:hypothetical protein